MQYWKQSTQLPLRWLYLETSLNQSHQSCPQIDPRLRFGSILGHDVTGLVKFQAPSSPMQPPEFDMTLQILGVAEDYLANIAFTSSLQGTTYDIVPINTISDSNGIAKIAQNHLNFMNFVKNYFGGIFHRGNFQWPIVLQWEKGRGGHKCHFFSDYFHFLGYTDHFERPFLLYKINNLV